MELKELFKYSQSDWVRYSDYEYRETADGELYIMPTKNATIGIYNPLQEIDKLLVDTLNIGLLVAADDSDTTKVKSDTPKIKSELLAYVKRYGLLGFMVSFPLSMDFLDKRDVLLGANPLTKEQTMKTRDYLKLFMPFEIEKSADRADAIIDVPVTMFMSRPPVYEIAFGRGYGEKYDWLCGLFGEVYTHFAAAFYHSKTDDVTVKAVYSNIANAFKMYGLGFCVKMLDTPTLMWDFSSLKITIETLYGFYLTNPDRPLRICKHCGKVFVSRNSKAEFCSAPCRNQFNVYKSRVRKII